MTLTLHTENHSQSIRELTAEELNQVGGGIPPVVVAGYIWGAFIGGFIGKAGANYYDHLFGDNSC